MPRPGWYNDNQFRQYPFISDRELSLGSHSSLGEIQLPEDAISDFGCITGLDAGFVHSRDKVWLYEIRRSGSEFQFEFRSDAPGLIDQYALIFIRTIGDPEFSVEHVTAVEINSISSQSCPIPCDGDEIWEGFMVHGKLEGLLDVMDDGDVISGNSDQTEIEPALIQSLTDSFVRGISLANFARTRAEQPIGCSLSSDAADSADLFVNARCLQGDLKLIEGYNCSITQNDLANSITINAGRGLGAGVPCDEVPNEGEESPDGGDLLTGGPSCGEIVKTINGVSGKLVQLKAGTGVRVFPHETESNTLVVDVDHHDQAICAERELTSLSSLSGSSLGDSLSSSSSSSQ